MRQVKAFMIYCPQKSLGCSWTGELQQIDSHENLGCSESGCDYVKVGCNYLCGGSFFRKDLTKHKVEDCKNRPVEVQFNALSVKLQQTLSENTSLRTELGKKLDTAMTKMKDLESRCKTLETYNADLESRNVSLESTVEEMKEKSEATESEKDTLKDRVSKLETLAQRLFQVERRQKNESLQIDQLKEGVEKTKLNLEYQFRDLELRFSSVPPFYFTIFNFEYYQKVNYHWQSENFYSHINGYNLSVSIYPNGIKKGQGSHISAFVSILRGKNDKRLKWPFKGIVSIEIYNYLSQKWERKLDVEFEDEDGISFTGQPIDCSCNAGLGFPLWMYQADVMQKYCHKGMVKFKVPCVEVFSYPLYEDVPLRLRLVL